MSNIYPITTQQQRYDEASQWIARLDKNLSPEEVEELQRWMAKHQDNEKVLLEMTQLWDKMDALGRLASLFPPIEQQQRPQQQKQPYRIPVFATAALTLVLLAAVALWGAVMATAPHPYPAPSEYVYQTGIGEHTDVTLADGSSLTLNTNSRVTVEYTDQYRLLTLERGEIYINVAKDKHRPLSVIAGDQIVQAVGTRFSVEITSDQQIELVVVEGKVKVGVHDRTNNIALTEQATLPNKPPRMVTAGEATLLGSPTEPINNITPADIEVKLSWRQGNLIFRGESLEDAVREVERYTPVEFVFLDQELKKIRVAGLFKAGDVEGLLVTLHENFDIVYQYTDEQKVLLRKK